MKFNTQYFQDESTLTNYFRKQCRRFIFTMIYALVGVAFVVSNAENSVAAPGDLDTSFGSGGKVVTSVGAAASVQQVVIQPDGKIVVAGYSTPNFNQGNVLIARYNSDGTPDTSFGTSGGYTLLGTSTYERVDAMVIKPDGKFLLLTGSFQSQRILRFNSNGTLDTSFGNGNGFVSPSFEIREIDLADAGKFYVGGIRVGAEISFCVARHNENGTLDTTFGTNGISVIPPETNYSIGGAGLIALQTDGKIIFGGNVTSIPFPHRKTDIMLLRLNSDGSRDTTFGTNGFVYEDIFETRDSISDLAIQTDGKILVAGTTDFGQTSGRTVFLTQRYNQNGSKDTTFREPNQSNFAGSVIQNFPGDYDYVTKMAIQANGKIVVGGTSANNSGSNQPRDFSLTRIFPSGALESGFGQFSRLQTDIETNSDDLLWSTAIQPDGKIVAVGETLNCFGCSAAKITLVRYLGDHSPTSKTRFDFDGDGKADIAVFRPSSGSWYLLQSQAGFTGFAFGLGTDKLAPADYDGDGKTDAAVVRNGTWYLQRSSLGFTGIQFGDDSDVPVPADYDGDGKADIAVFRPSNGYWYVLNITTNQFTATQFGISTDKPVAADYDGDGKTDISVNRSGNWYIQRSQLGFTGILFGDSNDKLVPADYDGDGKTDIAVFRPSNGSWYLLQSTAGFTGLAFGLGTDIPATGDYDGDGKADVAVVRNGNWYLNRSSQGFTGIQFGTAVDLPIPNAFVR